MKYSNFLATYALDRLEFGDTTKYIYEGIYEVLEGKHVDLTNLDNYVLKVLDPDIICEDVILTEEIKDRIKNGELQEVLNESNLLTKITSFLSGKSGAEKAKALNQIIKDAEIKKIPEQYRQQWINQMVKDKSAGSWEKIANAWGNYTSGTSSLNFAKKAEAAEKAAETAAATSTGATSAIASMKAFLNKGVSWVLNPNNFNVILGSVGGILALKLILRVLKNRRIRKKQRKEMDLLLTQQMNSSVKTEELLSEEEYSIFEENMRQVENLIKVNRQANRVEFGLTKENSPILNY